MGCHHSFPVCRAMHQLLMFDGLLCYCPAVRAVWLPATAAEAASKQQEKHSLVSVWEDHEMKEGECA